MPASPALGEGLGGLRPRRRLRRWKKGNPRGAYQLRAPSRAPPASGSPRASCARRAASAAMETAEGAGPAAVALAPLPRQRREHVPHSGGRSRERSARRGDRGTGSSGDKCLEASSSRGAGEGSLGLPLQLLCSPPRAAEEELCGEAWVACHSEGSWGSRYRIGFSLTGALEPLTGLGEQGRHCRRAEKNQEAPESRIQRCER